MIDIMNLAPPPDVKTRAYLDQPRRCDNPLCRLSHRGADFILNSGCHPDTPPRVRYIDGVLIFVCVVCGRLVDKFKVAQT